MRKGLTHNGISVNQRENTEFRVVMRPAKSYSSCNEIESIEMIDSTASVCEIKTICHDCDQSVSAMVNGQIKELIKLRLNEQMIENLRWHLTELLSNQHSTGPLAFG